MRQISLRHLRCFVAVAETGSFTAAANRLAHTQSSLTATIQQFEEVVGVRLFDRTTRRVALTDDARQFKGTAERILRDFDNALSDLQAVAQSQRGHVSIAASQSLIVHLLSPALASFRQQHPQIKISVVDGGSARIEQLLQDGEVEFGIASPLHHFAELDYRPLIRDPFGVICPHDHPLAQSDAPLTWADLPLGDAVVMTPDSGIGAVLRTHPELCRLYDSSQGCDRASSTASLYAMLSMGGRFSVLPSLAARTAPRDEFAWRVLSGPRVTRQICLITRRGRSLSATAERIAQVLLKTVDEIDLFGCETEKLRIAA